MRYMIDTNIGIYIITGRYEPLRGRVSDLPRGSIAMSAIVHAELLRGELAYPNSITIARLAQIIPVEPFDAAAAEAFGCLPITSRSRMNYGRLIAAHAVALDAVLVTNNERDFADVPGLKVENWTVPR